MGSRRGESTRRDFLLGGIIAVAAGALQPTRSLAQARATDAPQKPQPRKHRREEVKYQDEPYLGRSCARCIFYEGHGVCTIVEGTVSPNGWCTQWAPNTIG
jgi:hypothetical protein